MEDKTETTNKPERRRSASRGRRSSIFVPAESDQSQIVQVPVPHEMAAPNLGNDSKIDKRSELRRLIQFTRKHIDDCKVENDCMVERFSAYAEYIKSKKSSSKEALKEPTKNASKNEGEVRPRYFLNNVVKRFNELDDGGNEKNDLVALQRAAEYEKKKLDIKKEAIETFLTILEPDADDDPSVALKYHSEAYIVMESMKKLTARGEALNELIINLNERRRSASRGRRSSIFVPAESDQSQIVQVPVPHEMAAPNLGNVSKIDKRSELRRLIKRSELRRMIQFTRKHINDCKVENDCMVERFSGYVEYMKSKKSSSKEALKEPTKNASKNEGEVRPRYFLNNVVKRFNELDDGGNEKNDLVALQRAAEYEKKKLDIKEEAIETFLTILEPDADDDPSVALKYHSEAYTVMESMKKLTARGEALNELIINLNVC